MSVDDKAIERAERDLDVERREMLAAIRRGDGSLAYLCAREAFRCVERLADALRVTPAILLHAHAFADKHYRRLSSKKR